MTRIASLFLFVVLADSAVPLHAQSSPTADTADTRVGPVFFAPAAVFTQADLQALPIDDPLQAFGFAPGVIERSGYLGIAATPDIAIRGGPPGGAGHFIDGAPLDQSAFGGLAIALPLNAIAAESLLTSGVGADRSVSSNAVIAFTTRRGGSRFAAEGHAETDGLFGSGISVGYNRFDAALGGPIPGMDRVTWFVAGSAIGQESRYRGLGAADQATYVPYGIDRTITVADDYLDPNTDSTTAILPTFVQRTGQCGGVGNANTPQGREIRANYGQSCDGLRRPRDWTSDLRGLAKVRYAYGSGSSIAITGVANFTQQRDFPNNLISAPGLQTGTRVTSGLVVVDWSQTLGKLAGGPLSLDANLSTWTLHSSAGPLTPAAEVATEAPSFGLETSRLAFSGADSVPLSNIDQLISNVRENRGLRVPFLLDQSLRPVQLFRANPYGVIPGWPTGGTSGVLSELQETHRVGRTALTWATTSHHVVRGGFDRDQGDVAYYSASLVQEANMNLFHVRPRRTGWFVSDRYARGPFAVELGLRRDSYVPGGSVSNNPGRTFTLPGWTGVDSIDTAQRFHTLATQGFWLPHLQAAVEPIRGTIVRAGYARDVVPPNTGDQFWGSNVDVSVMGSGQVFGGNVTYAASSNFNVGLTQVLGAVTLDATYYRESAPNPYRIRIESVSDSVTGGALNLTELITLPFAASGIELGAEWKTASWLDMNLAFSHVSAGDESGGASNAVVGRLDLSGPRDAGGGVLGMVTRGADAVVAARVESGKPYTPCLNAGSGQLAIPSAPCVTLFDAGPLNSAHLPWSKLVDLRVSKRLATFGGTWSAFLDVRNLFNTENVTNLFAETGADTNGKFEAEHFVQPQIDQLSSEAPSAVESGAKASGPYVGRDIDLRMSCAQQNGVWTGSTQSLDCYALRQVENRFGNGDGVFTVGEQAAAFNAYYNLFYGPWVFHGPGRTARVGIRVEF